MISPGLLLMTNAEERVVFENAPPQAVPSLLRNFSAPVILDIDLTDEELLVLASRDDDPFNRWQSLEALAMRLLKRATVQDGPVDQQADQAMKLSHAFGKLLVGGDSDPAFAALALSLPTEMDIAREIGVDVDPEAVSTARRRLKRAVAQDIFAVALACHRRMKPEDDVYSPDAMSAGRRALRNAALDFMVAADRDSAGPVAMAQTETAGNMTDRLAALSSLVLHGADGREKALAAFEKRHSNAPLVMDKWFGLQSSIPEADTLARVRRLMRHPVFSLANPNRALALIGGFAMRNPTQFNRIDGAGYAFVAETALELDRTNPQVAARLMTAFRTWRNLETQRRGRARAVLESIAAEKWLSRDLSDIVERSLG
jgi:aminopeptidase N